MNREEEIRAKGFNIPVASDTSEEYFPPKQRNLDFNKTKVGLKTLEDAVLTREHNDSNVLCLSAKNTSIEDTLKIVDAYLNTAFTAGRHTARVDKVMKLENEER